MSKVALTKGIAWTVVIASIAGAAGAYRYFSIPAPLRFATTEALWAAAPFAGLALVAAAVLLLAALREKHPGNE